MYWVYRKADGIGDKGISVKGSSAMKELNKGALEVEKAFAVQSCVWCKGSLTMEEERHLHALKGWKARTLKMCE